MNINWSLCNQGEHVVLPADTCDSTPYPRLAFNVKADLSLSAASDAFRGKHRVI